jgi:hypothetical protein
MIVEQLLKAKGAETTIVGPEKTIGATARLLAPMACRGNVEGSAGPVS